MKKHLLLLMMLASGPAWAVGNDGASVIVGPISCGKFIENLKTGGSPYMLWVAGYLTAYNALVPDTFDVLGNSDMASVKLWLENYCKANPLEKLPTAMEVLINELRPKRHRNREDQK